MTHTLSCSYESHDSHNDFDYEEVQRKNWVAQILSNKAKPDRGPLMLVTFQDEDETFKVAVSETEGFLRFPSYDQISKKSDLGNYILTHKSEIKPGFVWKQAGAIVIDVDENFYPTEDPLPLR